MQTTATGGGGGEAGETEHGGKSGWLGDGTGADVVDEERDPRIIGQAVGAVDLQIQLLPRIKKQTVSHGHGNRHG